MKSKKQSKVSQETINEVLKLSNEGKKVNEIADILKMKAFNVRYYLNKHNAKKPKKAKATKGKISDKITPTYLNRVLDKTGKETGKQVYEHEIKSLRSENKQLKDELLNALRKVNQLQEYFESIKKDLI